MNDARDALVQRIRELRRRHFGARGKAAFAEKLGIPIEQYEQIERGAMPQGDLLLRICELTGEDLQWLLTGVPSRGTVVISGARSRHQELVARIAQAIDQHPSLAAPLEAFLSLLVDGQERVADSIHALPAPRPGDLIPILEEGELPEKWQGPGGPGGTELAKLAPSAGFDLSLMHMGRVLEPSGGYDEDGGRTVQVVRGADASGKPRQFVVSGELTGLFPASCGVRLHSDDMRPMFDANDALIVSPDMPARVGRAALMRRRGEPRELCRIWLGSDHERVFLGRLSDRGQEAVAASELLWSLEVLFRVSRAA